MPALPNLRRVSVLVALTLGMLASGARGALADTHDPVAYYGGPVAHSLSTVLVDWGPNVQPMFTNDATGDPALLRYLASQSGTTTDIGGVLAQYLDTSGGNAANAYSFAGQFQITPSVTAGTVQDSQIGAELVAQIQSGAIPAPEGDGLQTGYVVVFPPGMTICDSSGCSGQAFCSYHGSTQLPNGTNVLYVVVPDDTSGPMTQGCGVQSALQNQTMYMSHELAELITDPLVDGATSMGPPLGWYDANCPQASSLCGEVADKCNQQPVVEGGWTLQLVWSNLDAACVGAESHYASPSVSFTPPPPASAGTPITFAGTGSDPPGNTASATWNGQSYSIGSGITSLVWTWGDGTPDSTGASAVHTYATPGVYHVSLTAIDGLGFTSTTTQAITIWGSGGAPTPATGVAAAVRVRSATLTGTINPAGASVAYRFEYGTSSTTLTRSTATLPAPAGTTAQPVSRTVGGLQPGTTYFYRLDAVSGSQVVPGPVQTFTTPSTADNPQASAASAGNRRHRRVKRHGTTSRNRGSRKSGKHGSKSGKHGSRSAKQTRRTHLPARVRAALLNHSPTASGPLSTATVPVTATVIADQPLARALSDGLLVSFRARGGVRVQLQATLALPATLGPVVVPRVLAAVTATASRNGTGLARLRFSASARAWLQRLASATFAVAGYEPTARR